MNALRCHLNCVCVIFFASLVGCWTDHPPVAPPNIPVIQFRSRTEKAAVTWFHNDDFRYGLHNKDGERILPPTYDDVGSFSEGLAPVNLGAEWTFPGLPDGGKWGYVNEAGQLMIPIQFQYANEFSDGLARVTNESSRETMFIDRTGAIKIRLLKGFAGNFREGLAPVRLSSSQQGQGSRTEYIDKSGRIVFSVQGWGEEFFEGLAVCSVRGGKAQSNEGISYGYIDKTGHFIIEPIFSEALDFSDGLAAVRKKKTTVYGMGDSWGYIDHSGTFVINAIYNETRPFRDGTAEVHKGGELMEVYDAPWYWEGGTWWLINKRGQKVGKIVN